MEKVYPVFFTKTDECVLIEVPDLGILTEGIDMINAIDMARDAIELHCVSIEDSGEIIPEPSDITDLDISQGTFFTDGKTIVSLVDVNPTEYRRKIDTKTVRKNVSLPSWLNYEVEKANVNVSRILQDALINVLGVKRDF